MKLGLPISKPLALVLIGLIIGVSFGLGSGYAVFYPNMVNERSRSIEERISDVELNVTDIDGRISSIGDDIDDIEDSLNELIALTDILSQLSDRITALENNQVTLNSELNDIEDTVQDFSDEVTELEEDWGETMQSFADLESAYDAVNDELEDVQEAVRESDGITVYIRYMANPSDSFKDDITDEIYDLMKAESDDFSDWVQQYGENTAKILLRQEVDSLMGSLVWNPTQNKAVGDNSYQVKLETYFKLEFSPAGVTIDKIHLEVKALVDIDTEAVSSKEITVAEIL